MRKCRLLHLISSSVLFFDSHKSNRLFTEPALWYWRFCSSRFRFLVDPTRSVWLPLRSQRHFQNCAGDIGRWAANVNGSTCSAFLRPRDGARARPNSEHDSNRKLRPTARGAHVYRVSRLAGSGSGERRSRARGVKLRRYFVRSSREITFPLVCGRALSMQLADKSCRPRWRLHRPSRP